MFIRIWLRLILRYCVLRFLCFYASFGVIRIADLGFLVQICEVSYLFTLNWNCGMSISFHLVRIFLIVNVFQLLILFSFLQKKSSAISPVLYVICCICDDILSCYIEMVNK